MLAAAITVTTTATSLRQLLINANRYPNPQDGFCQLRVQPLAAVTNPVYIGDAAVSATNAGAVIPAAATPLNGVTNFGFDNTDLNLRSVFLVSTGGTEVVLVWIR